MTALSKAYFRWLHGSDGNEWAQERVDEIFCEDAEKGWQLILDLVEEAPTQYSLYYVAAGPLEMLIRDDGVTQ
ncbi:MAG TPA: hypothetical protein V6C81_29900 [Planktothrix sp.]|jgi:hypothetical protein